jgi:hypothetical protein
MLQVFDRVLASRSAETLAVLTIVAIAALLVMALLDVLRARLLTAAGAALLALALLAPGASAKEPKPGYTQFTGCPSPEENPAVGGCTRTVITGGNFKMGSKNVPIENPMTLVGGVGPTLEGPVYANAKGGLTPVKQKVPGGVIGLTGLTWLFEFFGSDALTLYATTELAGQPVIGPTSLSLPIKVHLETPSGVLGKSCYVGSVSNPITLSLNTGTTSPPPPNKPITGVEPKISFDEKGIIHLDGGQFVDNAFAAPGASGCTLTLFGFIPFSLNGLVNLQAGLPSPAGTNETRQNFNLELASSALVF